MVSVLKVGADDASNGNSEKPISPRMMEGGWIGSACDFQVSKRDEQ